MKNNHNISRDAIDRYVSGKPSERRSVEGQIGDDFDQDALDGWSDSHLTTAVMSGLDQQFAEKSTGIKWKKNFLLLGVASLIVGVILFGISIVPTPERKNAHLSVHVEQSDLQLPSEIEQMEALPKEQQISVREILTSQQQLKNDAQQANNLQDNQPFEFSPEALEPLPTVIENREVAISKQKQAKEIYFHQLKAIDYSAYREKPSIQIEQIILSGTPANLEDPSEIQEDPQTKLVSIPYMDYLNKTMGFINKGKWKQALSRLEEIIAAYPDDVNARFYAGWCYYNLQQYPEACTSFSVCLQLEFSNFNEEATWYLALSRLANGEKTEARLLFQEIKEQKGYYAKQAEKELKNN